MTIPCMTPRREADIFAKGFLAIITIGTLGLIAACFVAIWAVVELATLLLTATVECCNTIGQTFAAADPLVKFLLLLAIGFAVYHAGRRALRRA